MLDPFAPKYSGFYRWRSQRKLKKGATKKDLARERTHDFDFAIQVRLTLATKINKGERKGRTLDKVENSVLEKLNPKT